MSEATANRQIDLEALSWPASQTWDGTEATIVAPDAPDDATLQAEVDAAPDYADPEDAARQRFRGAVEAATSIADLKAALLGTTTNAEPDVRPR